jgi:hypothetical protein
MRLGIRNFLPQEENSNLGCLEMHDESYIYIMRRSRLKDWKVSFVWKLGDYLPKGEK